MDRQMDGFAITVSLSAQLLYADAQ